MQGCRADRFVARITGRSSVRNRTNHQAMNKHPRKPGNNVVPMPTKARDNRDPAREFASDAAAASAGGRDDPRTREAMQLIEAFLAIEDASARAALIALADSLVTHDWLRRQQER